MGKVGNANASGFTLFLRLRYRTCTVPYKEALPPGMRELDCCAVFVHIDLTPPTLVLMAYRAFFT